MKFLLYISMLILPTLSVFAMDNVASSDVVIDMSWLENDVRIPDLSYKGSPNDDDDKPWNDLDYCMMRVDDHDEKLERIQRWAGVHTREMRRLRYATQYFFREHKRMMTLLEEQEKDADTKYKQALILLGVWVTMGVAAHYYL